MYETERELMLGDLSRLPYRVSAMLRKNWKRYACVARMVEEHVPRSGAIRLLDYGCGYPVVVTLLRMRGYDVTGYEPYLEPEQVSVAEALGVAQHYRSGIESGDIYDVGLLVDVVEHLAVPAPVFCDIGTHLTSDAKLLVSTPNVLRFETYWSFVMRRTGHPTPLEHYLTSENSYVHHQRELSMQELRRLLAHFGYRVTRSDFNDTRPDLADLRDYHGQSELEQHPGLKGRIFDLTQRWLPASIARDNMMVLAERVAQGRAA